MVLNRFQMAAVKRTAANTKKLVAQREKVNAKMREYAAELISINNQIDAWETPIKAMTGGWTSEQVLGWNGNIPDEVEEAFKAEMLVIREKRAKVFREQEAEKEANLQKKLDIIEKIKTMLTTPEEANKSYQEFKVLQQEWKDIKNISASKANELWRNYQLYVEQYYDLLK